MKRGKQGRKDKGTRRKGKARTKVALTAHPAFAPLLGLWGALLGGLPVMVLPPALVAEATRGTMIGLWDIPVQPVLAALTALLLGTLMFVGAMMKSGGFRRGASPRTIVEVAARRVRPIDPVRDLGTRSIDDPIETMPFAAPAWHDGTAEAEEAGAQSIAPAETAPVPRELDLAEFAQLPGRDAVWVQEPTEAETAPEPAPEPVAPAAPVTELRPAAAAPPPPPEPGTAALARLRAVPPSELSLAEMVERFAAALQEHRDTPPARVLGGADLAAREAALAEALKALAAQSGGVAPDGPAADRDAPLRAALAQLQTRRGAA
jgi:hypothetical protein